MQKVAVVSGGGGGDATAANQATQIAAEQAILAQLADPATQTTLAAVLAALPVALTAGGNLKAALLEALPAGSNLLGKVGIDQTTPGATDSVSVKRVGRGGTVTITRPADTTAYTVGDVVGDANGSAIFSVANFAPSGGGEAMITAVEVEYHAATLPSGMTSGFKLRLYNASPTAIADNAAWDFPTADRGKYLESIQLALPTDEGGTLFSSNQGVNTQVTLTSDTLYFEMQTLSAFTPGSGDVVSVIIHGMDV